VNKSESPSSVFFNASVILTGLASPSGGSAKLLNMVKDSKLKGIISEVILDEVVRRAEKVGLTPDFANKASVIIFKNIMIPPDVTSVDLYSKIVIDKGDCHVLASAMEAKVEFLVSLDKKHILSLKNKIKKYRIVSPKELIEFTAGF